MAHPRRLFALHPVVVRAAAFVPALLLACSSSSGGPAASPEGGASSSSSSSGSGSGGGASLVVTGTPTGGGPVTVTFSGAAANAAQPGVYCEYFASTGELMLSAEQGNDMANLRLYGFTGASRAESFSSTGDTCSFGVTLVSDTAAFDASATGSATGGSCATTITEFDTNLQGTFDCTSLPVESGIPENGASMTMAFQCPVAQM